MVRRVLKCLAILAFTLLATEFEGRRILLKWRIRGEWADVHPDQITEQYRQVLINDGANILLGPIIQGIQAAVIFVLVAGLLAITRLIVTPNSTSHRAVQGNGDEKAA